MRRGLRVRLRRRGLSVLYRIETPGGKTNYADVAKRGRAEEGQDVATFLPNSRPSCA